jgi:hypothetical protein
MTTESVDSLSSSRIRAPDGTRFVSSATAGRATRSRRNRSTGADDVHDHHANHRRRRDAGHPHPAFRPGPGAPCRPIGRRTRRTSSPWTVAASRALRLRTNHVLVGPARPRARGLLVENVIDIAARDVPPSAAVTSIATEDAAGRRPLGARPSPRRPTVARELGQRCAPRTLQIGERGRQPTLVVVGFDRLARSGGRSRLRDPSRHRACGLAHELRLADLTQRPEQRIERGRRPPQPVWRPRCRAGAAGRRELRSRRRRAGDRPRRARTGGARRRRTRGVRWSSDRSSTGSRPTDAVGPCGPPCHGATAVGPQQRQRLSCRPAAPAGAVRRT